MSMVVTSHTGLHEAGWRSVIMWFNYSHQAPCSFNLFLVDPDYIIPSPVVHHCIAWVIMTETDWLPRISWMAVWQRRWLISDQAVMFSITVIKEKLWRAFNNPIKIWNFIRTISFPGNLKSKVQALSVTVIAIRKCLSTTSKYIISVWLTQKKYLWGIWCTLLNAMSCWKASGLQLRVTYTA